MHYFFPVSIRYFSSFLWCGLTGLILLSSCESKQTATEEIPDTDEKKEEQIADTAMEGDGRVDNYDYTSTDKGNFTEEGIWEQEPEFCSPPPFPEKRICTGEVGPWAKALQMALWFFEGRQRQ